VVSFVNYLLHSVDRMLRFSCNTVTVANYVASIFYVVFYGISVTLTFSDH